MAQFVDKAYLQEQFKQFLLYLKSGNIIPVDTSALDARVSALETAKTGILSDIHDLDSRITQQGTTISNQNTRITTLEGKSDIYVGNSAPTDSSQIWIDTSAN